MTTLPTERRAKQRATTLKKEQGITHKEALLLVANQYGFSDWETFKNEIQKNEIAQRQIAPPSLDFISDDSIDMTAEDFDSLDQERTDDIAFDKKKLIASNKRQLARLGIDFSVFEPTMTGFKKSIIDATQPVRSHFELEEFHYYQAQLQGPDYKFKSNAYLLRDNDKIDSVGSFYRPVTKKGDPRMWFKYLPTFATPGDQIAIIIFEKNPYLLNLSLSDLEFSVSNPQSLIGQLLTNVVNSKNSVANELLAKLKELAKAPFSAGRKGDTGIGFTIEDKLGIVANSSKLPDYKGIELKSGRGVKNRTTLFAQVCDWEISPCKRSAEILNKYGYQRDNDFKLYCTISTQRENSQGLSFIYNQAQDQLEEWHNKTELVAIWPGSLLRKRLKEKHAETFWIEAKSETINGVEHFQLLNITHTKSPVLSQLMPLIESGVITMDHLIKKSGKTGRVSEKGPLFKMNKKDLDLLFPKPVTYEL